MMKKLLAMLLALSMVFALCACGSTAAPAPSAAPAASDAPAASEAPAAEVNDKLTFATGGETGTYYAYGSVLAQYVSGNTGLDVTAITGNGSKSNVEDLDAGDIQLAFCQSDVMSYAYSGTNLFDAPIDSFSVVAALYMEQVQIVTMNPDIKTVADLKGKSVSIGAVGSGVYFNAIDVLGVYGMTEADIKPVYQSFGDSAESLKDGKIDAAFIVAGAPTTAITDLATSGQVYLVSIDDEHIDQLLALSPYYSKYTVPAATYGMPDDASTVAVAAVVLARNDVSDDAVYTFVSTIFDNTDTITEQHAKGAELSLEFASYITDVPYHPGAAKYFAEKGITVGADKAAAASDIVIPEVSDKLTFATGGETGTYYAYGSVLAQYVSGNTGLDVTAITGNGSKSNVEDLDAGDIQLAFCQSDVMSYAYSGTNLFDAPIDSFSVVAALYMEQVQIVTMNPDIKTVADLKGKSVSIGAVGSGVYFNAIDVLGVYGMTEADIKPVYQSFGDSAESLKDGKIDAAFIVAGAPTTAITDLATSGQVYLVSIDDEHIDQLLALSPYYSKYTVPAATYGMPDDASTVAVAAVVLARNDVSDDAVYTFVSTIFDNTDTITEQHAKGAELSLDFASYITDVPYHAGAARYFADKGIDVAK